mgnify:FL=1
MENNLLQLAEQIINGKRLSHSDNLSFFETCELTQLCKGADLIRRHFMGDRIDLCSIINAKSGRCGENCKFCAQSIFNKTNCQEYDFLEPEEIFRQAKALADEGVHRFSIVTSGKALSGKDFEKALKAFKMINSNLNIKTCASMGFISKEQIYALKEAGVSGIHHNIETSRANFKNICTSHTYEMKIETLKNVKAAGLRICSGGIIGIGETFSDRIEMALALSEAGADSIPINALIPIPGTAFENLKPLSENEILRAIAMFRYINPAADVRLAAGRKLMSGKGESVFCSGASATITGNMLTSSGTTISEDKEMFKKLGRNI